MNIESSYLLLFVFQICIQCLSFAFGFRRSNSEGHFSSWDRHGVELETFHSSEDAVKANLPRSEEAEEHAEVSVEGHDDHTDVPADKVSDC